MTAMYQRFVYYGAFTFLGLLLASLVHAALEIPILHTITNNIDRYGDTWLWQHWQVIHGVGSFLLWVAGASIGMYCGVHYWPRVAHQKHSKRA